MPYFSWRAIDLTGTIRTGFAYGNNVDTISRRLLTLDISLLSCRELRYGLWRYPITQSDKLQFFTRLHALLARGVFLRDALLLVYRTTKHPLLQALIYQIVDDIQQGNSLHHACAQHPEVFDAFTIQLLKAGETSGSLAHALHGLCEHAQQLMEVKKKIRSALMVPAITGVIFIAVIMLILMVVLPAFMAAFGSTIDLPASTKTLLALQALVSDWYLTIALVGVAIVMSWFVYLRKIKRVGQMVDSFCVYAPWFGYLYRTQYAFHMLQALGLLLERGVPIVPALNAVRTTARNTVLANRMEQSVEAITHGISVSQAFFETALVDEEGRCLLEIGQATGKLGSMMVQAAQLYKEVVYRALATVTIVIQPVLMLILGLLIVWVIAAVYMPILSLSTQISPY